MSGSLLVLLLGLLAAVLAREPGVCDPLVPENCLLPFPNNFYTRPDSTTPTGLRVVFPDGSSPKDRQGRSFSLEAWSRHDGFSISTAMMAYFPNISLSSSNTPSWQDIAKSLEGNCPTIVLDTATGKPVAHFTELDHTTPDAEQQAFMLWPAKQLQESNRYIVAMRNLKAADGTLLRPSEAFLALRDRLPSSDPDVEERRDHFEEIFTKLAAAGFARNELTLAWDFTVGSEKFTTQGMFFMRDDAVKRVGAGGPVYKIDNVEDNYSDRLFRVIEGTMTVPHYLTKKARPGSELVVDAAGIPIYQGDTQATFTVGIPHKCTKPGAKCPILVYGHGLLGTQGQVLSGTQQTFAETYGYILCGVDMWGMSSMDVPFIALTTLTDLGNIHIIPDRSHQGMLNQVLLMKMMAGNFAKDPVVQFEGASVVDVTKKHYWGISQGGILGAVYLAVSDDVNKAHLGVPGGPYPLLLARSVDFDIYFYLIKSRYTNPIDRILILSFLGLQWDRLEPSGYLNLVARDTTKRALIDYALGDAQVSYLGAYFMGRSINAKMFKNNVHCNETTPIYGIEELNTLGPVTEGSIMVGYEYEGIGCGPIENIPPNKETDTHGIPRNDKRTMENMHQFYSTGGIYDYCEGKGCFVPK